MTQYIPLKEGFIFLFNEKNKREINVDSLVFEGVRVLVGWMQIVDFIAILESANRNKLGTNKKRTVGDRMTIWGTKENNNVPFEVTIAFDFTQEVLVFDLVQVQQITSKLNKLIHMCNKLHGSQDYHY